MSKHIVGTVRQQPPNATLVVTTPRHHAGTSSLHPWDREHVATFVLQNFGTRTWNLMRLVKWWRKSLVLGVARGPWTVASTLERSVGCVLCAGRCASPHLHQRRSQTEGGAQCGILTIHNSLDLHCVSGRTSRHCALWPCAHSASFLHATPPHSSAHCGHMRTLNPFSMLNTVPASTTTT